LHRILFFEGTYILNTALFPHHTNATDWDYMHLYLCIPSFLTRWPVWQQYANWSVFVYCILVKENVQETLPLSKSRLDLSSSKNGVDL
jgi:hypothetical protein